MKISPKIPDWSIGIFFTVLLCSFYFFKVGFLETVELKSFDLRMRLFHPQKQGDSIAIIAIDDESIAKIGRWPWPRTKIAEAIDWLDSAGAKVIGVNILFSEPEEAAGLKAFESLEDKFVSSGLSETEKGKSFLSEIGILKEGLDRDKTLAASIMASEKVLLPVFFNFPERKQTFSSNNEVPEYIAKSTIPSDEAILARTPTASDMIWPLELFAMGAHDLGHANRFPDPDGISRSEMTVITYGKGLYTSFPISVAASTLGIPRGNIMLVPSGLFMGDFVIPTDREMRALINYYGPQETFSYYSFYDLINGKIDPAAFKGKTVLVGITALGLGIVEASPFSPVFPSIEKMATVIENILTRDFITRPQWAELFGYGMIIFFGLVTSFLLPRAGATIGAYIGIGMISVYTVVIMVVFSKRVWLDLTYPTLLLVINYTAIVSRKYLMVEKEKTLAEYESDEANKLLGLTFQGKGMLDLAFEKFKTLPLTGEVKGLLYNLGLDFERKRMASKAAMIYEHIAIGDKDYKDIGERLSKLKSAVNTGIWAGAKASAGGTAIIDGMEKPTIGRYEIVKELGRGAMGVVYLGVDPKINRQVAIKTVYFDEVDPETLQSIKDRFFREAESAGKLAHQNIVTIYDVGEETDLAYIAMELIEGKTLEGWCKKNSLLPPKSVLMVIGQVCEALDFAHKNGIVHRDIKPANIMVLQKGVVKVTDFGIARIQSASHTRTGVVMGTPSYMSPEQVAGQKVDGRSDLFSLGVVLYELLTGVKPFKGDSMATVMFQITTTNAPDIREVRTDLHPILQSLIAKALAKKPEDRFQTGKEFANAIRVCLSKMAG